MSVEELQQQAAADGDGLGPEPRRRRRGNVLALAALLAFLRRLALLLLWVAASGGAVRP